jgi:hypothetical protein
MSKGGGGGPTNSTVTQNSLPEYARPYFENILDRGQYESLRPFEAYQGQRIADFAPREQIAMQGMENMFTNGDPSEIRYASGLGDPSRFQNTQFSNDYQHQSMADPGAISQYMNPYQQNVTDIAKREAGRASEIQGNRIADQASMAGGLGGYREAIMQAERQRNLNQQMDDIQMRGSSEAFGNAQQAFGQDRADQQFGSQFGLSAEQAQAGANQYTRNMELDSGRFLQGLGSMRQDMGIQRIGNLQAAGENQRGMAQQSLDTGYGDFLTQQAFPRENISFMNNVLQGLPVAPGSTTSSFAPQPSDWQQALGSGIAGVGLYNQFR